MTEGDKERELNKTREKIFVRKNRKRTNDSKI